MYSTYIPLYIGGKFYSPGDSFDAPESAVASYLKSGDVYLEESNEPAAAEPTTPVDEAPVAPPEEPHVEEAEESPAPKLTKKGNPRKRQSTSKSAALAKESESEEE